MSLRFTGPDENGFREARRENGQPVAYLRRQKLGKHPGQGGFKGMWAVSWRSPFPPDLQTAYFHSWREAKATVAALWEANTGEVELETAVGRQRVTGSVWDRTLLVR